MIMFKAALNGYTFIKNIFQHFFVRERSGRVLDSRPKGRGFKPHRRHCVVSLSKNINPSLVLIQSRKTRPFITERLLMGRKESNQTNKNFFVIYIATLFVPHFLL